MPKLTIDGRGEFEVPQGTRLVNALEDHGGEPLHRCGGYARCTTCRVEFLTGETWENSGSPVNVPWIRTCMLRC